ncbi:hypothetical protein KBC99_03260, partial [Candidatus Saccharibacteria bacterium]|nr:hypothetical protein [Candidatus Saccharibacteria bacterium]
MKNILYKTAFVFGLLALVGFGIAHASDQKFVSLDKDTTINSSYIRAGNNVTINGTVNGDVIVAGSNIIIDGTVNGNVYAAG